MYANEQWPVVKWFRILSVRRYAGCTTLKKDHQMKKLSIAMLAATIGITGCADMSPTQRGTATGAGIGAGLGAVLGGATSGGGGKRATTGA
ncbi:MAG: hypothetical protein EOP02_08785, partial [Proteobacteria bacterium]